jgi:hypothetical protein
MDRVRFSGMDVSGASKVYPDDATLGLRMVEFATGVVIFSVMRRKDAFLNDWNHKEIVHG